MLRNDDIQTGFLNWLVIGCLPSIALRAFSIPLEVRVSASSLKSDAPDSSVELPLWPNRGQRSLVAGRFAMPKCG